MVNRGRVLITGGAGFIGSHLADRLIGADYTVRILDALLPQVHAAGKPSYLNPAAEFRHGDVRDEATVHAALADVDIVVHFAAVVGVGQSMYEVVHYSSINVMGTATLLAAMVKRSSRPQRLVVASSMSIYGEGLYACPTCGPQAPGPRPSTQLERRDWSMRCPTCGKAMEPRPTPESKAIAPASVYAINKRDQEELVLVVGRSLGIPAIALRFFNAYGDRQALSNPYTGVCAIFSSALLNRRPPLIFEDGGQMRDFIHVSDIAAACQLAIERRDVSYAVINVGTGRPTNLLELTALLRREIPGAKDIEPSIVEKFREGDIRCCYADITRAKNLLGFSPVVPLEDGVKELSAWVATQSSAAESEKALGELQQHGLVR